jgi:molecular chaperone GrpE
MSENTENLEQTEGQEAEEASPAEESSTTEASELEDYKKKFYYVAAEMENMKKRFEREKENLLKFGNEKVLSSLIEVIDNLERTVSAIEGDKDEKVASIAQGIHMVRDLFLSSLKKFGLEQIEALDQMFDPNFHEAMAQQPAEGKEDNTVLMEYQKGYVLNGRLIRASKVVVVKN